MNNVQEKLKRLSLLKIAERAEVDLYYLCENILGYDLLDPKVHGPLCRVTRPLLFWDDDHDDYEFPTDYGKTDEEGIPSEEDKKKFWEEQQKFEPNVDSDHAVEDKFDPELQNILLLMPRSSLKSSVITIGFTIQYILKHPDARILLDSETHSKASAFLAEIKGHFEDNEKLREIYYAKFGSYPDDQKRDNKWSDSALELSCRSRKRKEPSIECSGVGTTKNGMHYDLIIMDDLHSEKNTKTREEIEKVIEHYKLAYSLLDPGRPAVVIGTRWDYNDLYQHIIDNEKEEFNFITRSAESGDGELFFPSHLTREHLRKKKKKQGAYIYSCQYLNKPVDDESATFKRQDFQYREWDLVKSVPMNWYLSIDPSYEGQYSDYAAFVLCGMSHERELFVRKVLRRKMTYADIINVMFDWYTSYKPKQILLETIATQKNIQYMLNEEQKHRGMWLPVKEIKQRTRTKEERIRSLAPFYEFHRIYHVKECDQLDALEYELIHFPKAKHDDVIDALANVLEVATPPRSTQLSSEKEKKRKKRLEKLNKPRSPMVGY